MTLAHIDKRRLQYRVESGKYLSPSTSHGLVIASIWLPKIESTLVHCEGKYVLASNRLDHT
jgi:hypothetical protein